MLSGSAVGTSELQLWDSIASVIVLILLVPLIWVVRIEKKRKEVCTSVQSQFFRDLPAYICRQPHGMLRAPCSAEAVCMALFQCKESIIEEADPILWRISLAISLTSGHSAR